MQQSLPGASCQGQGHRAGQPGCETRLALDEITVTVMKSSGGALHARSRRAAAKADAERSGDQVREGVSLVGETGVALERIVAQIGEINTVVADIATSAQEQATGLQEVITAINQMDQVTQQNAAMDEQSTAASGNLARRRKISPASLADSVWKAPTAARCCARNCRRRLRTLSRGRRQSPPRPCWP